MNVWQLCNRGDLRALAAHLENEPGDANTAIQSLAQSENLEGLRLVLQHRPSAWALQAALAQASSRRGAVASVRELLAAGASAQGDERFFPLHAAAAAGEVEALQVLLAAGADPNAQRVEHGDPDGAKIPLVAAVRARSAPAVAVLLAAGADPNVMTPALRRPLEIAEELGDAEVVQRLRERGARVVAPGELSLDQAARRGFVTRVRELMPTASAEARGAALVAAVEQRKPGVAAALLEGGRLDARSLSLALGQCMAFDVQEVVPLLLAAGVDRNAPDNYYHSPPIVLAAERGRTEAVRDLLAAEVDLTARDEQGQNALAAARKQGHAEIVALLQAAGATARTPAQIEKAVRKKLAAHARSAWMPRTGEAADEGDPSQFGGLPRLLAGEAWPTCADCRAPLVFFVQVDLGRAPEAARSAFGVGLLQLFHCTACDPYEPFSGGHRVRIVPVDATAPAAAPEGVQVFATRRISGWQRAVRDFPYREVADAMLEREERPFGFKLNHQGDKLGGWPNWVQDPTYPRCPCCEQPMTQLVLQIDSERGVPYMWGDNGAGYLFQCAQHREQVAFTWQCS